MEWLLGQIYSNFIEDHRWRYLTNGLKVTLEVTFFAVIIGIVLGLLIADCAVHLRQDRQTEDCQFPLRDLYHRDPWNAGCGTAFDYLLCCVRFCEDRQGSGGYHGLRLELRRLCG